MHTFDGYSIKDYGEMVTDPARTQAFVSALTNAITPESVVLEIGTGAGFVCGARDGIRFVTGADHERSVAAIDVEIAAGGR